VSAVYWESQEVLEVPEVIRRVLLCMLEAVEGGLRLPEVMCCVLLCMLEAAVRSGGRDLCRGGVGEGLVEDSGGSGKVWR
jgi:hypothetical protein